MIKKNQEFWIKLPFLLPSLVTKFNGSQAHPALNIWSLHQKHSVQFLLYHLSTICPQVSYLTSQYLSVFLSVKWEQKWCLLPGLVLRAKYMKHFVE
jgi:hypothetical protein